MDDGTSTPAGVRPLRGTLVGGSDGEVRIRSGNGTWVFSRDDVSDLTEQDGEVTANVRIGAEAEFIQSLRITVGDRPMTLPDRLPESAGEEELQQLAADWADQLAFTVGPWPGGGYTASACASDSHGFTDDYYPCDSLD